VPHLLLGGVPAWSPRRPEVTCHIGHTGPGQPRTPHPGLRPASATTTANPLVSPVSAQTWSVTTVSSPASCPTAHPRTADATTLRNPTPAGVSAPRSDPPAQPQHAAAQPIHPANPQGTHPQATGNPAPEDHLRRASRRRPGLPQLNSYLFSPYPFRVQVSHRIQRYTHQSLPAQRGIQPSASWRRRVFQDVGHSGKPSGAERTWTPGGSPKDTVADATAHGECCPDGGVVWSCSHARGQPHPFALRIDPRKARKTAQEDQQEDPHVSHQGPAQPG
jgi:hypothetical protein